MRNQTLPGLDLTANYGATAWAARSSTRSGSGVTSIIIGTVPGGYGDAWRTLTGRDYPTWNLALNFSYPIGASAPEAQVRARASAAQPGGGAAARARTAGGDRSHQRRAAGAEQPDTVPGRDVARELAQQRLDAEQSRFDVGLSTNYFVVQAQRDLATAQNTELRALLDYRKALVDYERLQEAPATRGAGITTVTAGAAGSAARDQLTTRFVIGCE